MQVCSGLEGGGRLPISSWSKCFPFIQRVGNCILRNCSPPPTSIHKQNRIISKLTISTSNWKDCLRGTLQTQPNPCRWQNERNFCDLLRFRMPLPCLKWCLDCIIRKRNNKIYVKFVFVCTYAKKKTINHNSHL